MGDVCQLLKPPAPALPGSPHRCPSVQLAPRIPEGGAGRPCWPLLRASLWTGVTPRKAARAVVTAAVSLLTLELGKAVWA